MILVEANLTETDVFKDRRLPIEEETRTMAADRGGTHKTTVLAILEEEIWIHEQIRSKPETEHLDVAHNLYRFRPTAKEKR
jgi:hypothetical protein